MTAASANLRLLAERLSYAAGMGAKQAAEVVLASTANAVAANAKALAPYRTGRLANSITAEQAGELSWRIGPKVVYGVFQEFGTASRGEFGGAPYVIRPVRANMLAFQIGGRWVFTKEVHHPGIPAHPFMRPALAASLGQAADELARAGALLITKGPNA